MMSMSAAPAAAVPNAGGWHSPWLKWMIAVVIVCVIVIIILELLQLGWQRIGGRTVHYKTRLPMWTRVRWHLHPGPGYASAAELAANYSLARVRRTAKTTRPSLTWTQRRFGSPTEYATFLGTAFIGWRRYEVWAGFEDVTLVIAPPRSGKSGQAGGFILDAPAAAVASSIREDLIRHTAGLRAKKGRIHVLNAMSSGANYASTFAWDPIAGCQDSSVAVRRAGYMVEAISNRGLSDEDFWSDQASMALAAYLYTAALAMRDMTDVYGWIMSQSTEPLEILERHEAPSWHPKLKISQFLTLPDRTQSGIVTTIDRVMRFMSDPVIARLVCPSEDMPALDIAEFVTSKDTLYLVAGDTTSPVAALFVALLAEITYEARRVGGIERPARAQRTVWLRSRRLASVYNRLWPPRPVARLDPPLTFVLDEMCNIAPVPVPAWVTWVGGSGIHMFLFVQALAHVEQRWGRAGAETIWGSSAVKVVYGGGAEPEVDKRLNILGGKVSIKERDTTQGHYDSNNRWVHPTKIVEKDVLPIDQVRRIPAARKPGQAAWALVCRGDSPITIVQPDMVWRRREVKEAVRLGLRVPVPAPQPRAVPQPRPMSFHERAPRARDDLAERRARRSDHEHAADQLATEQASGARPTLGIPQQPASFGTSPGNTDRVPGQGRRGSLPPARRAGRWDPWASAATDDRAGDGASIENTTQNGQVDDCPSDAHVDAAGGVAGDAAGHDAAKETAQVRLLRPRQRWSPWDDTTTGTGTTGSDQ